MTDKEMFILQVFHTEAEMVYNSVKHTLMSSFHADFFLHFVFVVCEVFSNIKYNCLLAWFNAELTTSVEFGRCYVYSSVQI